MDITRTELRVGEYSLKPDPISTFLIPFRQDKEPVPKPLQGRWMSASDFRKAAQDFHGDDYSTENLRRRSKRTDIEGVEVSSSGA